MCPIGTAIFVNFKSIPSFFSNVSRTEETLRQTTIAAIKKTGFHNFAITSYPFSQKRRVREETYGTGCGNKRIDYIAD